MVKYRDLNHAVKCCLDVLNQQEPGKNGKKTMRFSKSDLTSAFRILLMKISHPCWLVLMAEDLLTGKKQFFVDKCLPFGASISCAQFQKFSDALQFINRIQTTSHTKNHKLPR